MKKLIAVFAASLALLSFGSNAFAADFTDVPKGHWAYGDINELRGIGVTDGIGGNNFGLGQPVTRAQFAAFLANLMKWESKPGASGGFADNADTSAWYYRPVEAARQAGATDVSTGNFRPNDNVTREEMAVMLVNALGYSSLASALPASDNVFTDVSRNAGYITIAKDFGIVSGMDAARFEPTESATREQAAAMLMRMHRLLANKADFVNGFYAIKSAPQMDYISTFDSVGFGWSKLEYGNGGIRRNDTTANNNEYYKPEGYEKPLSLVNKDGLKLLFLGVEDTYVEEGYPFSKLVMVDEGAREMVLHQIYISTDFDGIVIDFEGLKGEDAKAGLNEFLKELRKNIGDRKLFVAVHPARRPGQEYFDGYDFRTIGDIADYVILMAHDYNAKRLTPAEMEQGSTTTPLAPIGEVYYALKTITDQEKGVRDKSKVLLQINFDVAQWKSIDGKVINETPYRPDYETLTARINSLKGVSEPAYSELFESPYIAFKNTEDGTDNIVWYENARSVAAKMKLADMFGIGGISVWRLGNIPDDAWAVIAAR